MISRSLTVHAGIFVVAGVLALRTYTKDENVAERQADAAVWEATPENVDRIRFEHADGHMDLEPRMDKEGRYLIGTVEKEKAAADAKKPPTNPHDPHGHSEEGDETAESTETTPDGKRTIGHFIAVKEGQELLDSLAPLKALRVLGRIDEARKPDFGFDKEEEGRLYVTIDGKERKLVFGGPTPGGSDRYVTDPATGEAYVIAGSILRDLMSADQRLMERSLHGFEDNQVKRVRITVGGTAREFVRSEDKRDFWANPAKPDEKDETASNWISKLERLRVTKYLGEKLNPPMRPDDVVVKVEYFDERRPIGYIELARRPGPGDRPDYVARTEHTRWFADVLRSTAEQIDQDVKAVIGQ